MIFISSARMAPPPPAIDGIVNDLNLIRLVKEILERERAQLARQYVTQPSVQGPEQRLAAFQFHYWGNTGAQLEKLAETIRLRLECDYV